MPTSLKACGTSTGSTPSASIPRPGALSRLRGTRQESAQTLGASEKPDLPRQRAVRGQNAAPSHAGEGLERNPDGPASPRGQAARLLRAPLPRPQRSHPPGLRKRRLRPEGERRALWITLLPPAADRRG